MDHPLTLPVHYHGLLVSRKQTEYKKDDRSFSVGNLPQPQCYSAVTVQLFGSSNQQKNRLTLMPFMVELVRSLPHAFYGPGISYMSRNSDTLQVAGRFTIQFQIQAAY
jgi:hypothetical protein